MLHFKCRNVVYPASHISRLTVSDTQVLWDVPWRDYNPPEYNSDGLRNKPWADPDINEHFKPQWNSMDGNINRMSHCGTYRISNGRPLNPTGRTGLQGRGLLGRWGPNHAADPIVTRWKLMDGMKQCNSKTKLPVLEVCLIQRRDCGEWALPGGMIDPGEQVSATLRREFLEEACNRLQRDEDQRVADENMVNDFFADGNLIYKGYVDDPRNTDNAWMETVAMNFHDEDGTAVGAFSLEAGDDAKKVKWVEVHKELQLYASHSEFLKKVVEAREAHW